MTKLKQRIPLSKKDFAWALWKPDALIKTAKQALVEKKKSYDLIKKIPASLRTFENTIYALEQSGAVFSRAISPIDFLMSVSPKKEIREAAKKAMDFLHKKIIDIEYDEKIYRAVQEYSLIPRKKGELDGSSELLLKDILLGYKRMGFDLSKEKRTILKKKMKELGKLDTDFTKEISDWKDHITLSLSQTKGLPEHFVEGLKKDKKGNFLVSLEYPELGPFMEYSEIASKRKELSDKNLQRGGKKNTERLQKILKLRGAMAKILGYKNYIAYSSEVKMAKSESTVFSFIEGLIAKVRPIAALDIEQLHREKQAYENNPRAKAEPYDIPFLSGRIKRRDLNIDTEKAREYFPVSRVISGTFSIYEKLFSVKFKPITGIPLWEKNVSLYGVYSLKKEIIGYFALDLYPREGKYSHMAVFPLFPGSDVPQAGKQPLYNSPFASMIGNFNPPTKKRPSLLSHGEVETFFHEFGHLMHDVLTEAQYASQSGTSVATDFVEVPSQMFENWTWNEKILSTLSGHYENPKKKLPKEMLEGLMKLKKFQQGYWSIRQLIFALYDLKLHEGKNVGDIHALYRTLVKKYTGFEVAPTALFASGWGHLVGYAASYYSYMWSLVYAQDLFTRFEKEGVLNARTGMEFRTAVLSQGGSTEEMNLIKEFLGREPNNKAFLKELGIR